MLFDPLDDWLLKEAASRAAKKRKLKNVLVSSKVQPRTMSDKENYSPMAVRRTSNFLRSDSSLSSSIDLDSIMLQPTETSSISTNGSNEEVPTPATLERKGSSERWKQLQRKASELWSDFHDAISETNEQLAARQPSELERLNPLVMQSSISKCLAESHVYLETLAGIYDFFTWKNPLASLCAYCILMYCLWKEIFVPIFLGLIMLQLALNYLETQQKINIGIRFLPRRELPQPTFNLSGLQLIFDVARYAQMMLGILANVLQKLRSLFMWRSPEVTLRFIFLILFFFTASLFSINTYIIIVGFLCVNKMFTMEFLYYRFPQTRYMFDIAFYFYRATPLDARKKSIQAQQRAAPTEFLTRSCTFVDKSEGTSRTLNGTIILTGTHLEFCSKSNKVNPPVVVKVAFDSMTNINKIKNLHPLSRLKNGSSKGIEVEFGANMCYRFLGISGRREFFKSLVEMARLSGAELRNKCD
ncbi:GRAM domain-containing protein 4 [Aphelenchoides bicaudatus]|nr:GRAM domain-containing protein 4 [Aphelenchoides bicaudatus]